MDSSSFIPSNLLQWVRHHSRQNKCSGEQSGPGSKGQSRGAGLVDNKLLCVCLANAKIPGSVQEDGTARTQGVRARGGEALGWERRLEGGERTR